MGQMEPGALRLRDILETEVSGALKIPTGKAVPEEENHMNPKLLLTISAIYLGLVGIGIILAPTAVLPGLGEDPAALLLAEVRVTSGIFIGLALVNWVSRNAEASKVRDGIFLGNTIGFAIATIFTVVGALAGGMILGWILAGIGLLFTAGFFLVGRANMTT
jgi:hypothetical protein